MRKIIKSAVMFIAAVIIAVYMMPLGVALADQADPDSVPTVESNCYRNLIETGDFLCIEFANVPYGSIPTALVTEAFIWRLIDTDGVTELGQTVGSVFQDSGYGFNIYSFYFTAADAPTWNQNYTVRLSGNPSIFDVPPEYNFTLTSGDFSALTDQSAVQDELGLRIISIANTLDTRWALSTADSLIKAQETGTVLSTDGEIVFRAAIFGVQAMAPGVFDVVVGTITATDRTWDNEYAANISTQYTGTFIRTAQVAGASMFGKSYDLVSIILVFVLVAGVLVGSMSISKNAYSGMLDATLAGVIFARLGMYDLSFLGLLAGVCWIYFSGKVWGLIR